MLRSMSLRLVTICLVSCLTSCVFFAQTPPGSGSDDWNAVLRIRPTAPLAVELLNGVRINGKFARADANGVTLRIDKTEHLVPRENTARITPRSHRCLWLGLAGGIALGVAWRVSDTRSDIAKGDFFGGHTARNFAHYYIPAVGGVLAGALADRARNRPLYKVPSK